MPKVTPLPVPRRTEPHGNAAHAGLLLVIFRRWLAHYRRRRSLRQIPTGLLNDVLPDGDTRFREQMRRAPKRIDTGLWS